MARRARTRELYDRLLQGYRDAPGNHAHAARVAGMEHRACKRAWEEGWPPLPWAIPIKDQIYLEQEQARLAALQISDKDREAKEAAKQTVRQAAIDAHAEVGQAVVSARKNAMALMGVTQVLFKGLLRLNERTSALLEKPDTDLKPEQAVRISERISKTVKQAAETMKLAIVMEHLHLGRPTEILGLTDADGEMSMEEALREIEIAREDADRFKQRVAAAIGGKLEVIDGGKSTGGSGP